MVSQLLHSSAERPRQITVFTQYSFEVDVNRIKHFITRLIDLWPLSDCSHEKKVDELSLSYIRPVLFIRNSFSMDQIERTYM